MFFWSIGRDLADLVIYPKNHMHFEVSFLLDLKLMRKKLDMVADAVIKAMMMK